MTGSEFDDVVGFGGICLNESLKKTNINYTRRPRWVVLFSIRRDSRSCGCRSYCIMLVLPEILVVNKKSLSMVTVILF